MTDAELEVGTLDPLPQVLRLADHLLLLDVEADPVHPHLWNLCLAVYVTQPCQLEQREFLSISRFLHPFKSRGHQTLLALPSLTSSSRCLLEE